MTHAAIQEKPPFSILNASQIRVKNVLVRYEALGRGEGRKKKQLLRLLRRHLQTQLELEGAFLYPAIRSLNQVSASRFVSDALRNHEEIRALLDELTALDSANRPLDLKMDALRRCVLRHLGLERFQIASLLRLLSGEILRDLSSEMGLARNRLRSKASSPKQRTLYPTLQSESGAPEDDVDTTRALKSLKEGHEVQPSEFDNWGSE